MGIVNPLFAPDPGHQIAGKDGVKINSTDTVHLCEQETYEQANIKFEIKKLAFCEKAV
jgi:hypothetical protein